MYIYIHDFYKLHQVQNENFNTLGWVLDFILYNILCQGRYKDLLTCDIGD